jgi:hypothetical protein
LLGLLCLTVIDNVLPSVVSVMSRLMTNGISAETMFIPVINKDNMIRMNPILRIDSQKNRIPLLIYCV